MSTPASQATPGPDAGGTGWRAFLADHMDCLPAVVAAVGVLYALVVTI